MIMINLDNNNNNNNNNNINTKNNDVGLIIYSSVKMNYSVFTNEGKNDKVCMVL